MKAQRQRRIVQLIRQQPVTSQTQLVKMLRDSGFPATQATVSRDLEELGAVKVRAGGAMAYSIPSDQQSLPTEEQLRSMLVTSVLNIESSANIVILKTPPGHAGMVAAAIDRSDMEGIAGTVAGDDTIMAVCRQGVLARRVERRLRELAQMIPTGKTGTGR